MKAAGSLEKTLCETCRSWVRCGNIDSSFCLCRDLFTPTHEAECGDYAEGEPMTEEEFDGK